AGGQMQADDDAMNDAADPPPGYLAAPRAEPVAAVLVLHAWWGLNDTTKRVCDRLAGAGYLAFAPDLYHGQVTSDIAEAETLSGALDPERARADVGAGLRHLLARSGRDEVAVIG